MKYFTGIHDASYFLKTDDDIRKSIAISIRTMICNTAANKTPWHNGCIVHVKLGESLQHQDDKVLASAMKPLISELAEHGYVLSREIVYMCEPDCPKGVVISIKSGSDESEQ